MSRPKPRKSSLAGSSPLKPPEPEKSQQAHAEQHQGTGEAAEERTPIPQKKAYRHKVSFYQEPQDTDRVRGAILHTMTTEGNRNLSQFINRAVMAEVQRLEDKYNDGKPFPPLGARELPQGGAAADRTTG